MRTHCLKPAILLLLAAGCVPTNGLSPRETRGNDFSALIYAGLALPKAGGEPVMPLPILHRPLRVGVIQAGEVAPPPAMMQTLRARPDLIAQAEPMPGIYDGTDATNPWALTVVKDTTQPADDVALQRIQGLRHAVERMRALASDMGLDYLLIFGGTLDPANSPTPLEVFDLTIIGLWLVPSHEVQADAVATAALVDVRSGRVVRMASAHVKSWSLTPPASTDGGLQRMMTAARQDVCRALAQQMLGEIQKQETEQ